MFLTHAKSIPVLSISKRVNYGKAKLQLNLIYVMKCNDYIFEPLKFRYVQKISIFKPIITISGHLLGIV